MGKPIVYHYQNGARLELGPSNGYGQTRVDTYTRADGTWVLETCIIAHHEDRSPRHSPEVYDASCPSCWLHHTHSVLVHERATGKPGTPDWMTLS